MPSQDHDANREAAARRRGEGKPIDPMSTTSVSRAMWSALVALAIVAVMFGVFYDLSARRDQTASGGPAITAPQTTGQGGALRDDAR
jgi:hypothetical protein